MEEVTLRPITLSDTDLIVRWRNSDAVRLNMYDQRILTAEQHRDYIHKQVETGVITQYVACVGSQPVGTVYYRNTGGGRVELGLFIGERNYRSKGYGKIILRQILSTIGYRETIREVILKVKKTNKRAIKLYHDMGFKSVPSCPDGLFIQMKKIR